MKMLGTFTALLLATLAVVASASAQTVSGGSTAYGYGPGYVTGYYPYGYRYFGGTTAAESHARGWATLIYAQGLYNRLTAEARTINADAASKEIDNRAKGIEHYFAMRQVNQEARAAERGEKPTPEQLARISRVGVPKRIGPEQLDPETGGILWPELLREPRFAEHRSAVDEVFSLRAQGGSIPAESLRQVRESTEAIRVALRAQVRDLPPSQYIEAQRFLDSLAYEAQTPTG